MTTTPAKPRKRMQQPSPKQLDMLLSVVEPKLQELRTNTEIPLPEFFEWYELAALLRANAGARNMAPPVAPQAAADAPPPAAKKAR